MRKAMAYGMATLMVLVAFVVMSGSALASPGTTWTVDDDGPADFSTIQAAVDAASPDDTIIVGAGTYYEEVNIDKPLTLLGEDRDTTIIDAGGVRWGAIDITADYVKVSGFTLRNRGESYQDQGISIVTDFFTAKGGHRCEISGNKVDAENVGIRIYNLRTQGHNLIKDNIITGDWNGISLEYAKSNTVRGNTITGASGSSGIAIGIGSNDNTIEGNTISDSKHGITMVASQGGVSGNHIRCNTITRCERGIWWMMNSANTIEYNNIFGNAPYNLYAKASYGSSFPAVAENNWWGSDPPDAEKFVGDVDYNPWLTEPAVCNQPPVADAGGPYSGYVGAPITFDASASNDPDGTIVLYEWDWDGNGIYDDSTTDPTIAHTWYDSYTGTVGLRVTDDGGLTATATTTVEVISAHDLKEQALDELNGLLPTGDDKLDKKLDKAIEHIQKSLNIDPKDDGQWKKHELWLDDNHLDPKHGNKVFDDEKKAVKELKHLMDKKDTLAIVKGACQAAIHKLVAADKMLAQTAYDEAEDYAGDPKVDKELEKADKELEKAIEELNHVKKDGTPDPHYDKAIDHYKKAWEHACKAQNKLKAIEIEPLAITDEVKVVAYPNPIRDVHTATFQAKGALATQVEEIRVQIYDLSGRLVWEDAAPGSELDWHTNCLSGDYLANGMYLYRVQLRIDGNWISQDLGKIAVLR